MMSTSDLLPDAQLSVMRALLGEITSEMRAVTVEVNARHITVRVYHDDVASEEAWEDFDAAMTDVYADFHHDGPEAITIDYRFIRCDLPAKVPGLGWPVFARKGTEFREWGPADPF